MAFTRYWPVVRLTMAYKSLFIFLILHVALAWRTDSEKTHGNPVSRFYRMAGGVHNIRNSPVTMKNYGSRPLTGNEGSTLRWGNSYGSPYSHVYAGSGNRPSNSYESLIATILEHITESLGMSSGAYNPPSYDGVQNAYAVPGQGHLYDTPPTGMAHSLPGAGEIYDPSGHYLPPSATYGSSPPGISHPYNAPRYGQPYEPSTLGSMHDPGMMGQAYLPPASATYQTAGFGQPYYSPQLGAYHGSPQIPHSGIKPSPLNPYVSPPAGSPQGYSPYNYPSAPLGPASEPSLSMPLYNPSAQLPATDVISQSFANDLFSLQAPSMAGAAPGQFLSNSNNFPNTALMSKQMGPTPTYTETGTDHPCTQPVTPGPTSQDMREMGNLMKLVRVLLSDHHRGNKEDSNSTNQLSKEEGCNLRSAAMESGDAGNSEEIPEVRKKPVRKVAPFLRDR